jgi:ABC-type branched-subunit amino acid transport system ATPase component
VFLVIGANGMGKTTTIGKLAHRLKQEGNQKVVRARRQLLLLLTPGAVCPLPLHLLYKKNLFVVPF